MIAVVVLAVIGYALLYTGLGNLTNGQLTGGNTQGLLASLGFTGGLSAVSGFRTDNSGFRVDVTNPPGWDSGSATGATGTTPANPPAASGGLVA